MKSDDDTRKGQIPTFAVVFALALATLLTLHLLPKLPSVLLLVFAGLVLAVILDALTSALRRILLGRHGVAYAAALVCMVVLIAVIGLLGVFLAAPLVVCALVTIRWYRDSTSGRIAESA